MIRVVTSTSGAAARAYFGTGLSRADYYTDEIIGKWHGKGAERLELSGTVDSEEFSKLVENLHPETGDKLNPRVNANRTAGWDINFHAPKSFSIAVSIGKDTRLIEAFRAATRETMTEIEAQITTRVRTKGLSEDRETGEGVWAEFVHLSARPIGGIPDPHTHIHAYLMNTTFDTTEGRWKAAKIKDARREMPLHQARFHSRLALKVKELGYQVVRTRTGWEIAGIDRTTIDKFSRRTSLIEREAERRGIKDEHEKEKLGALTREGKLSGLTEEQLQQAWEVRLTPAELDAIRGADRDQRAVTTEPVNAKSAIDHALEKVFARDAVVRRSRILAEALRFGVGQVSPEAVEREYRSRQMWERDYDGDILATHSQILAEEIALVAYVRQGKHRCAPLVTAKSSWSREFLSDEQKTAAATILASKDRVIALRGGAGTGKTTVMQEIAEQIEGAGKSVIALAPSAEASRGTLREAGFENADTVARFLVDDKLQKAARGQVVWVDEAGLLGTRELWALIERAGPDTRIILTGDHKQHSSPSRGAPFYVMQRYGGLKPAEILEIRRQTPKDYRMAVDDLSQGNLKEGFSRLDGMGAFHEIESDRTRYDKLAADYVGLSRGTYRPLVVSPTNREGREVTSAIRHKLRETGKLGESIETIRFRPLHLSEAEKREPENYEPGQMIQFHQNAKGVQRGDRFKVQRIEPNGEVFLSAKDQREVKLNATEADKFQLFTPEPIQIAEGERIRITRNGKSLNGIRHANGNVREVEGFTAEGHIRLTTGAVIDRRDGHFTHGYCQTSHTSQSKSVKDVLIAQSSESFAAANREQFYVSVSRGKERVTIYTDDKSAIESAVGISGAKRSAIQLARESGRGWNEMVDREMGRQRWREAGQRQSPQGDRRKICARTT